MHIINKIFLKSEKNWKLPTNFNFSQANLPDAGVAAFQFSAADKVLAGSSRSVTPGKVETL
jgi:hypothetical protein